MVSAIDRSKRALVGLLKTRAAVYGVVANISRDSPDTDLRSAYRRIHIAAGSSTAFVVPNLKVSRVGSQAV